MNAVSGGCQQDDGHGSEMIGYRHHLTGQPGTCLSGITKAQGYWDCPTRGHPDDQATVDTATDLMKYADDGLTAMTYKRHLNGSKVAMSFVCLEDLCSSQERDCVVQGILGSDCFDAGIPNPRSNCNISVDVPGGMPSPFALHQNVPNPFNPITAIRFGLQDRSRATLKVYDVTGREVRMLIDCVLDQGEHTVTWNGEDNRGREAASGIYFYRLDAATGRATRKMVLLR
jgi:hypothetical protein